MLVREMVRQRFPSVDPSWRKRISGAIYIPLAAQTTLSTLNREGPEAFLAELEKLAALASPWASALLAFQALLLRPDGTRDVDKAIKLCKEPAAHGDAFAQYMLAWAMFIGGDRVEALVLFKASARQLFPPAVLDAAGLFWISHRLAQAKGVLTSLEHAKAVGHYGTAWWRYKIYRSGKLGLIRRIAGYLGAPVALLYYAFAALREPFSAQVFSFDANAKYRSIVRGC